MKNPFWKHALLTGASMAVGILLLSILLHLFDQNPFGRFEFMFLPIYLVALAWGLFRYRKQDLGGYLEGWRAVSFGLAANFAATFIYAGMLYGFLRVAPSAFERHQEEVRVYREQLLEYAKSTEADTPELSAILEEGAKNTQEITIAGLVLDKYIKIAFIGVILAMIAALFMMRKRPAQSSVETKED